MRFHVLATVAMTCTLASCSHTVTNKPQMPFKVGKSWVDQIKTKKPSKRVPAATKRTEVEGLEEFLKAVKENPGMFDVPVGSEVVKEVSYASEEEIQKYEERTTYIAQNKAGYFTFTMDEEDMDLEAHDRDQFSDANDDLKENVRKIQKLSETKYILTYDLKDTIGQCQLTLDVKRSSELFDIECMSGDKLTYKSTVKSVEKADLASIKEKLKSATMTAYPRMLEECDVKDEDGYDACNSSVTDSEAEDWSYLIK